MAAGPQDGHDWGAGVEVPRRLHAGCRDAGPGGSNEARLDVLLDADLQVTDATLSPAPTPAGLVGLRAAPGLRAAIARTLDDATTPAAAVLLDLGIGGNLSSFARLQAAREAGRTTLQAMRPGAIDRMAGSCHGWARDGELVKALRSGTNREPQRPPAVPGPDLAHWHDLGGLAPGWVRRRRRIDVGAAGADGARHVAAAFRDSWCDPDGQERSLHEWELDLTLDPDGVVVAAQAVARSLPFTACPHVAHEVPDVIGTHVGDLRRRSRAVLGGEAGCTHLDDLLATIPGAFVAATTT